jgi:hypothetical protein
VTPEGWFQPESVEGEMEDGDPEPPMDDTPRPWWGRFLKPPSRVRGGHDVVPTVFYFFRSAGTPSSDHVPLPAAKRVQVRSVVVSVTAT